jgi:hypothetical protein
VGGPDIIFQIQVTGDLSNLTACSFTSWTSVIPPGDLLVIGVGRFQGGEQNGFGYVIPCSAGPLVVSLASFEAAPGDGRVDLQWQTASEIDNAGFAVLRRDVRTGKVERVNPKLIPGAGTSTTGGSYSFVDTKALNGKNYLYMLEDWDVNAMNTIHPPKRAVPNPRRPPISLLSPGYESKAERRLRFAWEASTRMRTRVEISADPAFPRDETLALRAGGRSSRSLTAKELNRVLKMGSSSVEKGVYWRVVGGTRKSPGATSQVFFLSTQ